MPMTPRPQVSYGGLHVARMARSNDHQRVPGGLAASAARHHVAGDDLPAAPVQEMTTSAAAIADGRSSSPVTGVVTGLTLAARRSGARGCGWPRLCSPRPTGRRSPWPGRSSSRPRRRARRVRPAGPRGCGGPRLAADSSTGPAQQAEAGPALSRSRPWPAAGAQREPPSSPIPAGRACSAASLTAERTWRGSGPRRPPSSRGRPPPRAGGSPARSAVVHVQVLGSASCWRHAASDTRAAARRWQCTRRTVADGVHVSTVQRGDDERSDVGPASATR